MRLPAFLVPQEGQFFLNQNKKISLDREERLAFEIWTKFSYCPFIRAGRSANEIHSLLFYRYRRPTLLPAFMQLLKIGVSYIFIRQILKSLGLRFDGLKKTILNTAEFYTKLNDRFEGGNASYQLAPSHKLQRLICLKVTAFFCSFHPFCLPKRLSSQDHWAAVCSKFNLAGPLCR